MSELSGNSGQLKPCPWCNGEAYAFPVLDRNGEHDGFSVLCFGCDASIETYASKEKAIFAWNTRPIEDELLEKLQQLRAQWESVPWDSIYQLAIDTNTLAGTPLYGAEMVRLWVLANAPHEESPTTEQLRALVELIRKA